MNKPIFLILNIVFVTLVSCQNNSQTTTKNPCSFQVEDSLWTITINNGKGDDAKLSDFTPLPEKLESYIDLARQVDPELDYTMKSDSLFAKQVCPDSLVIDSIGSIDKYDVFYVSNEFVMLRSVFLRDCTGKMRLLYTESDHVGSSYSGSEIYDEKTGEAMTKGDLHQLFMPKIVRESGKSKLVLKNFVGGNKDYISEFTWEINPSTHIPILK